MRSQYFDDLINVNKSRGIYLEHLYLNSNDPSLDVVKQYYNLS